MGDFCVSGCGVVPGATGATRNLLVKSKLNFHGASHEPETPALRSARDEFGAAFGRSGRLFRRVIDVQELPPGADLRRAPAGGIEFLHRAGWTIEGVRYSVRLSDEATSATT